jgi:hypothetical protein
MNDFELLHCQEEVGVANSGYQTVSVGLEAIFAFFLCSAIS